MTASAGGVSSLSMATKQKRRAKDTLTAVKLDRGETLEFTLRYGRVVTLEPATVWAEVARASIRSRGLSSRWPAG